MNTITNTVIDTTVIGSTVTAPAPAGADEVTVSMVEVDAAAARAALTEHLRLPAAELEHPSVVAVLAAVIAAGWRPRAPGSPGGQRMVPVEAGLSRAEPMLGDSAGIGRTCEPPGRPR